MGYGTQTNRGDRAKSLTAVIIIHGALGYALVTGMGVDVAKSVGEGFKVINVTAEPPREPESEPAPVEKQAKTDEGTASAENLKAKSTPLVAPEPKVKLKVKSPVVSAPKAGPGSRTSAGASDRRGQGFGSGGAGDGSGSGRAGKGTGGGGAVTKPRLKSGSITRKDYPRTAKEARAGGTVTVHYTVQPNGRVSGCRVKRSSSHPDLDAITCRLIEQRFRYEPARDARGNAIADLAGWRQDWWLERGGRRVAD